MIKVENVTFAYRIGGFRIDIPQLDISAGEKVAVIGPSGQGKTTLLHLLSGVLVPSAGRVVVDGIEVSRLSREDRQDYRALRLGMVFQEFELIEYLDVIDNVLLPYRISPVLTLNAQARSVRNRWSRTWDSATSSGGIPATCRRASDNASRSVVLW